MSFRKKSKKEFSKAMELCFEGALKLAEQKSFQGASSLATLMLELYKETPNKNPSQIIPFIQTLFDNI